MRYWLPKPDFPKSKMTCQERKPHSAVLTYSCNVKFSQNLPNRTKFYGSCPLVLRISERLAQNLKSGYRRQMGNPNCQLIPDEVLLYRYWTGPFSAAFRTVHTVRLHRVNHVRGAPRKKNNIFNIFQHNEITILSF